jgi:hypothetical protein
VKSDITKCYDREWTGYGENQQETGYANPGHRWRGGTEAKSLANGLLFKLYFIHAASPCIVSLDVHVVRLVSIPPRTY